MPVNIGYSNNKEPIYGAANQPKDGRKNKKKKDFSRKDIAGSEMDAFIDQPVKRSSQDSSSLSRHSSVDYSSSESRPSSGHSSPDSGISLTKQSKHSKSDYPMASINPAELTLAEPFAKEAQKLSDKSPVSSVLYSAIVSQSPPKPPKLTDESNSENKKGEQKPPSTSGSSTESSSDHIEDMPEPKAAHLEFQPINRGEIFVNNKMDNISNSNEAGSPPAEKPVEKVNKSVKPEKPAPAPQPESKHKKKQMKKKEKKKGRKSPPHKEKPVLVEPEDKEDQLETKPPLPPSAIDRQVSSEKSTPAPTPTPTEAKPAFSYAAAATGADKPKEASPAPKEKRESVSKEATPVKENGPPSPTEAKDSNQNNPEQGKEKSPSPPKEVQPPKKADVEPKEKTPEPKVEPKAPEPVVAAPQPSKPEPAAEPPKDKKMEPVVNDENVPPANPPAKQKTPEVVIQEAKVEIQVVPKVTSKRDENGRLVYDRSYLMDLRSSEQSLTRPDNLPDLEIILDTSLFSPQPVQAQNAKRGTSNMGGSLYTPDFTPSFFQPGVGGRQHAPPMGKSSSRGRPGPNDRDSMQGGRMGPPKVITRASMGNDSKPLHKAENAWMPSAKTTSADKAAKNKTLEQETLFIMNRLTPTNFEKLAGEMRKLNVTTYEDLQELVRIFFDKVTLEVKFVSAYALLCKVMAQLKVPPPQGLKETQATFRVVMLTKCQQEFEADKSVVFEDPDQKKKDLEAEMPADTAGRAEKIEQILYHMKLRRLKFYGNIRFIGELFKLGMLTENIMHDCIFRLLKAKDDDSLVSLCNLVTTVGKNLDTEKAKARMDQYFTKMDAIAEERKSRIKFVLKDVIELRRNNWIPRKETTGPKKITEVHKDFEQEQATKQFLQNQPLPPREPQSNNRRGSRQRQDQDRQQSEDGWNTVATKSIRMDPSKMKLSKSNVVDDNIQLGPGGGMSKFGMWGRGSFGGASPQQSQDERQAAPSNRFSALRDDKQRVFERSPSRESAGRGMRQTPSGQRGKMLSRPSQEGERDRLLASARSIVGGGRSQNASRENSWNREDRRTFGPRGSHERDSIMTRSDITPRGQSEEFRTPAAPAPVAKKVKEMTEEEMETKAKNILEEYLNVRDLNEAKLCVTELTGQPKIHLFVTGSINDVLERSAKDRESTGQLLNEIVKSNIISLDILNKGFGEVLEFAEDMVIDIPMMWRCLGELMAPLLAGGALPMPAALSLVKAKVSKACCPKLLAQCLLVIKEKNGEAAASTIWQSANCDWSEFMSASEVDGFLQDKKIQFAGAAAGQAAPGASSPEQLGQGLEVMLGGGKSNEEVIAFIEKNVSDKTSNSFIRALTTAVASSSISKGANPKANEEELKKRKDVLQRYINSDQARELQALYAIQALMTKLEHPSGVISSLFDTLYDEDVIGEESCKAWEKSTDPAEQEGKGVCSKQLTQFFSWLCENDEPNS